jgi:hypothetical protein
MKIKTSLLSVLGLIFLVLKLTEVINWSWWLVLLPFYLVPGILLIILLIAFIKAMLK